MPRSSENSASAQQAVSQAAVQAQAKGILPESVSMGVDIVEVERIRAILGRSPAFAKRAFSEQERAYCDSTATPEFHYATRFAAKEAVLKALGTGFSRGIKAADVEVALNAKGKPSVRLHGRAAQVAAEMGVEEIPLSLSYTHNEAVACAIALTANSRITAEEKKPNPAQDLSRQFKEARSLLDELPVSNPEESA